MFTGAEATQLPAWIMAPVLFAAALLVLWHNADLPRLGAPAWVVNAATIAVFFLATLTGLMVSWGAPNLGGIIGGVQSRYFVPVLPLLALLVPNLGVKVGNGRTARVFLAALVLWTYMGMLLVHIL